MPFGFSCTHLSALRFVAIFTVLGVVLAHVFIVPHLRGYYGHSCYNSKTKYEAHRLLFQRITTEYEDLKQVYWVDYGLLLGYFRHKDMMPHDGDLDLGRIHNPFKEYEFDQKFQKRMAVYPETEGNAIIAAMHYTGEDGERVWVWADLFRYHINTINGTKMMVYHWNKPYLESARYRYYDQYNFQPFPYDLVFPLQRLEFLGVNVTFPNNIEGLLAVRYPHYKIPIPNKWKCYIPGNLALMLIGAALLWCLLPTKYRKYCNSSRRVTTA